MQLKEQAYDINVEFIMQMKSLSKKEKERLVKEIKEEEKYLLNNLKEALREGSESRYWIKHIVPGPQDPNFPKYMRFNIKEIEELTMLYEGMHLPMRILRRICKYEKDNNSFDR